MSTDFVLKTISNHDTFRIKTWLTVSPGISAHLFPCFNEILKSNTNRKNHFRVLSFFYAVANACLSSPSSCNSLYVDRNRGKTEQALLSRSTKSEANNSILLTPCWEVLKASFFSVSFRICPKWHKYMLECGTIRALAPTGKHEYSLLGCKMRRLMHLLLYFPL